VYDAETVREVFRLHDERVDGRAISLATGVSYTQVRRWLERGLEAVLSSPMRRPAVPHHADWCASRDGLDGRAYSYLLGQYLGDGTIVKVGRCQRLEIMTTEAYPGIRSEVHDAIERVLGRRGNERRPSDGVVRVTSYSSHWSCLFPQHGPGRKHLRPILLEPWQIGIALDAHPAALLRGLVHSDGCRNINWATAGARRYEYVRYSFSNRSADIHGVFAAACDRLGVDWRRSGRWTTSVSRRESVATLDELIGPKY